MKSANTDREVLIDFMKRAIDFLIEDADYTKEKERTSQGEYVEWQRKEIAKLTKKGLIDWTLPEGVQLKRTEQELLKAYLADEPLIGFYEELAKNYTDKEKKSEAFERCETSIFWRGLSGSFAAQGRLTMKRMDMALRGIKSRLEEVVPEINEFAYGTRKFYESDRWMKRRFVYPDHLRS